MASPSPHHCSFQWYRNYIRLHGKTQSRLLVKSAVDSDAGEYYCVVANRGGTSDSEIAFVKVVNPHSGVSMPPTAVMPMLDSMASCHGGVSVSSWSGGAPGAGSLEGARNVHPSLAGTGVGPMGRSSSSASVPPPSLPPHLTRPGEDLIGRGYHSLESQPASWGGGSEGVIGGGGVGNATVAMLASGSISNRRGSGGMALSMGMHRCTNIPVL